MSRINQANAYWSQLMGGGRGTAANKRALLQYGGAIPVTPEAIEAAAAGSGNAGRQALMMELLGQAGGGSRTVFGGTTGSGRASSTPHFGVLTGERSQIQFTDHGSGQTFNVDEASPQDQAELLRRQAMEDEAVMEARARALGTIAGRMGDDAQAARQILGVPVTPGYEQLITPEQDAIIQQRIGQEAAVRSAIEQYASQPFATQQQVEDLWQQHNRQFPGFQDGQRPMTRAEQMEQMKARKLAVYQAASPGVPLDYDQHGNVSVVPGYAEAQRSQVEARRAMTEARTARRTARMDAYRSELEVIKAAQKVAPDDTAGYMQAMIGLHNRYKDVATGDDEQPAQQQQQAPPEQGSSLPVNRQQFDMYQQQAASRGLSLVSDQSDYDSLAPGETYIDAADGLEYEKPRQ